MDVISEGLRQELQKAKKKKNVFRANSIKEILKAIQLLRGPVTFQEVDLTEVLHYPDPGPDLETTPTPSTRVITGIVKIWDEKKKDLFKRFNIKDCYVRLNRINPSKAIV